MNVFESDFLDLVGTIAGENHTFLNIDGFRASRYLSAVVERFLATAAANPSEAEQQVFELVQNIEAQCQAILNANPTNQERRAILSQHAAANDVRDLIGIYWLCLLALGMMTAMAVCVYYTVKDLQAIHSLDSFPGWSQCESACSQSKNDCTTSCNENYLAGNMRRQCLDNCADEKTNCLQNCSVALFNSTDAYINIPNKNINLGAESFGLMMGALVAFVFSFFFLATCYRSDPANKSSCS